MPRRKIGFGPQSGFFLLVHIIYGTPFFGEKNVSQVISGCNEDFFGLLGMDRTPREVCLFLFSFVLSFFGFTLGVFRSSRAFQTPPCLPPLPNHNVPHTHEAFSLCSTVFGKNFGDLFLLVSIVCNKIFLVAIHQLSPNSIVWHRRRT